MISELRMLERIAPELVAAELRPLVESLKARARRCDGCGKRYIQKRRHPRNRGFHDDDCRYRARKAGQVRTGTDSA